MIGRGESGGLRCKLHAETWASSANCIQFSNDHVQIVLQLCLPLLDSVGSPQIPYLFFLEIHSFTKDISRFLQVLHRHIKCVLFKRAGSKIYCSNLKRAANIANDKTSAIIALLIMTAVSCRWVFAAVFSLPADLISSKGVWVAMGNCQCIPPALWSVIHTLGLMFAYLMWELRHFGSNLSILNFGRSGDGILFDWGVSRLLAKILDLRATKRNSVFVQVNMSPCKRRIDVNAAAITLIKYQSSFWPGFPNPV